VGDVPPGAWFGDEEAEQPKGGIDNFGDVEMSGEVVALGEDDNEDDATDNMGMDYGDDFLALGS